MGRIKPPFKCGSRYAMKTKFAGPTTSLKCVKKLTNQVVLVSNEPNDPNGIDLDAPVPTFTTINCTKTVVRKVPTSNLTNEQFKQRLASWSTSISCTALTALLKLLRRVGLKVPSDYRSLRKTPRHIKLKELPPGKIYNRNLREIVVKLLNHHRGELPNVIQLHHNTDGMPPFNNSMIEFWPIQCKLGLKGAKPFFVSIWAGPHSPENFDSFYADFVDQALELFSTLIEIRGQTIRITDGHFAADAPATSKTLAFKGHSGYNSCVKCEVRGERVKGRVIFRETDCELRDEERFRNRGYDDTHSSYSIVQLERYHTSLLKSVILDYMHLVLLGGQKRLIRLWVDGDRYGFQKVWRPKKLTEISKQLLQLCEYFPNEFKRTCRRLEDYTRLKANELRNFLLYIGPILLKENLPHNFYVHFLHLHAAIRILCNPHLAQNFEKNRLADKLLLKFVEDVEGLYGLHNYSHNIHSLIHLADDALEHGALDEFSCFPYENKLQELKKKVKANQYALEQVAKRIEEEDNLNLFSFDEEQIYPQVSIALKKEQAITQGYDVEHFEYYEEIIFKNFKFKTNSKDCFYILKDKSILKFVCAVVDKTNDECYIKGVKLKANDSLYTEPLDSRDIGIYVGKDQHVSAVVSHGVDEIASKLICFENENQYIYSAILHTDGN